MRRGPGRWRRSFQTTSHPRRVPPLSMDEPFDTPWHFTHQMSRGL